MDFMLWKNAPATQILSFIWEASTKFTTIKTNFINKYGRTIEQLFAEQQEFSSAEAHPSFEQWMKDYAAKNNHAVQNQTALLQSHSAMLKSIEIQIGQLAKAISSKPLGALPSDTEFPRRDEKEVCKDLQLRNGREVDQPEYDIRLSTLRKLIEKEGQQVEDTPSTQPSLNQTSPQEKDMEDEITAELEKQVPKSKALQIDMQNSEVPQHVSRARKLLSPQRLQKQQEEHYLPNDLSPKLENSSSFTIHCAVEDTNIGGALCDLGSNINLMYTSIVNQLGMVASPTTITPQLVVRSLEHPDGKINNILVKVYRFIFPADFIILDFEAAKDVPIILDRPFLVK
ncbi:uncharacterized protein LOC133293716 [Gastrolobium bilobum]|uniref:uncharacterized protein LOC133293716 n=1 Tax=Gastrolobium bilobum TaxID=150636 RepID=UPI002AB20C23|nr:uncharacterized protein LOC133293716 [Gastrolobium bilobum]